MRVKVTLSSWRQKDPEITVTVINRGLAPVDLISLAIGFQAIIGLIYISELSDSIYGDDEALLHRLDPGSQRHWHYPLSLLAEKMDEEFGSVRLNWFFTRLHSGRPRIKWRLYSLFIPLLVPLYYLMSGLVVCADLGNGVQKSSFPNHVLLMKLVSRVATLESLRQKALQANESNNPNSAEI
jgi:hypothetical protein